MASVTPSATVDGIDPGLMVGAVAQASRPKSEISDAVTSVDTEARISSDGMLQNALAAVVDSSMRMAQPATWQSKAAFSSQPDVVSATSKIDAPSVKFSVKVDQLASPQVTTATMFAPFSTTVGIGNINLSLGEWNSSLSSFTPNPNWPKASVTAGPGDVSVEKLRDRINAAGVGVVANVISDATGTYLLLRSSGSGVQHGFKVSVDTAASAEPTQAAALQSLGFNPAASAEGMKLAQAAQDAELSIDGQAMTSSSNLVQDAVAGVDLTLKAVSDKPVDIKVDTDRASLKSLARDFVSSFNELQQQLEERPRGDSPVRDDAQAVQSNLASIWQSSEHPELKQQLAQLGIRMDDQGALQLDERKLDTALAKLPSEGVNLQAMAQMVSNNSIQTSAQNTATKPSQATSASQDQGTSPLAKQRLIERYTEASISENNP